MKNKKCKCGSDHDLDVKMSTPGNMKFNTPYTMDHTLHSKHYWDTNRNIDVTVSDGQSYIVPFDKQLDDVVKKITNLLKEKNKAYGNSALNPANIFSRLNATEALCARIDDKIMRIKNKGINDQTEDTVDDLIGYLLLLKMSQ